MKFNIPIEGAKVELFTLPSREPIAKRYERIVIGKRGPYVEFVYEDIDRTKIYIPQKELWRLSSPDAYYIEYRTNKDYVMVYHQRMAVTYADYKIGMIYISPTDLTTKSIPVIR